MHCIIVPTAPLISKLHADLVSMEEANYDIDYALRSVIDRAIQEDTDGCTNYDILTAFDGDGMFYNEQDHAIYADGCKNLAGEMQRLFKRCNLYHNGILGYWYAQLLNWDVVLRAKSTIPNENLENASTPRSLFNGFSVRGAR